MLDYESRINLNISLNPIDRQCKRFSKRECLSHHMYCYIQMLTIAVDNTSETSDLIIRSKKFLKICNGLFNNSNYLLLIKHNYNFRQVVINKINQILDKDSTTLNGAPKYFKMKIRVTACAALYNIIHQEKIINPIIHPTPIKVN